MLSRRAFLATGLGAGLGADLGATTSASAQRDRPNVLFLSVDDMNDWVGCLGGYPGVKTPNIDKLAARGALFADAHCTSPVCNPSRTALLTGLRPSTTGVYGNNDFWPAALPDVETLPAFFRRNGYHVAGAGKVFHHTAGFNPPDQWDEFQLQEFDDFWYRRVEWYPWVRKKPNPPGHPFNGLAEGDFAGEFDWGALPDRPEQTYGDMAAVRYGQAFLEREHHKPFFLAVGLWHPHIPLFAPQDYYDLYPPQQVKLPEVPDNDLDDLPPVAQQFAAVRRAEHERIVGEGKWKDAVQSYLAAISFADAMVGQVLRALEESAYADNTIIVLWSDHGWHLGEKRHWHKSTLWQRSTHVPMIWAGPGVSEVGVERSQPVELIDMYPTLADLCGLHKNTRLEGESLAPLLSDSKAERRPAVVDYQRGNHAVITQDWRYIRYYDGGEELYDRVNDPNEWKNLADEPGREALKTEMAQWMPPTSAPQILSKNEYDFDFQRFRYWKRE